MLALEPEFEAVFESNSYGSRSGLGAIDAIKQIHICCRSEQILLDVGIEKCFERFDYDKLLELVGH